MMFQKLKSKKKKVSKTGVCIGCLLLFVCANCLGGVACGGAFELVD
jgi:hypothetical protein